MTWLTQERKIHPVVQPVKLPYRFHDPDWHRIPEGKVKLAVHNYLSDFDNYVEHGIGMLLSGRSATWKTYGAAVIAHKASTIGELNVDFVQCSLVLNHLSRQRYNQYDESRTAMLQLFQVPLLVMDDFTQIRSGTAVSDLLVEIAEARFANKRPTIWTCNINLATSDGSPRLDEISQKYGVSFARRLAHGSKSFMVNIT